jgi:cation transport ATPase
MAIRDRIRTRRGTTAPHSETRGPTRGSERRPARAESQAQREASPRARQRDEFGGINWGAAFFGWIVAVGIAALLTALVSAAGAAVAISSLGGVGDASENADTIGIVGGIALFLIALLAYYAGGYVAGRMSRFDGARQGLAVWLWGLVVAIVLAVLGAIAGNEYNVFGSLNLPRIPIDEGTVTTGGVIVLIAVTIGTILAAMAGGKTGERYHRRVDMAGGEGYAHER